MTFDKSHRILEFLSRCVFRADFSQGLKADILGVAFTDEVPHILHVHFGTAGMLRLDCHADHRSRLRGQPIHIAQQFMNAMSATSMRWASCQMLCPCCFQCPGLHALVIEWLMVALDKISDNVSKARRPSPEQLGLVSNACLAPFHGFFC